MLDLKFIRTNPDVVKKAIKAKNEKDTVDEILVLDERRRKCLTEVEELKYHRRQQGKKIAAAKKNGEDTSAIMEEMSKVADRVKELDQEVAKISAELETLMLWIPNMPDEDVPEGDESNNQQVRNWGEPKEFSFTPKPHWELGDDLDILDSQHTVRLAGSGFIALKGLGARLERALLNFMLDVHTGEHGYTELTPPHLVNRRTITFAGQLPKLEEDMYHTDADDFFLIPTSEVPLATFYQDEMLAESQLPIYLTAMSSCFRREAGAAGKDTRGLLRVHEFKKVEMIKLTTAEESPAELESMVGNAETILQRLGIPYRIVILASGDMSFVSRKTYDLEIWAPGVDKWLEVSSCSNAGDFQARRANIRYKKEGEKPNFVHILNGSGVAIPRLVVAIMENYQREDGHIDIPEVLQPYMGGLKQI